MDIDFNKPLNIQKDTEDESAEISTNITLAKEICRLCGKETINYVSIYDNGFIAEKISRCLPIIVHAMDKLPSNICKRCLHYLNISYKLTINCMKVDSLLRKKLKNTQLAESLRSNNGQSQKPASLIPRNEAKVSMKNLKKTAENGPMLCELCSTLFLDMNAFDKHMESNHLSTENCNVCKSTFSKSDKLLAHKTLNNEGSTFICKFCTCNLQTNQNIKSMPGKTMVTEVIQKVNTLPQPVNLVPVVQNQAEKIKSPSTKTLPNIIRPRNTSASKYVFPTNKNPIKLVPFSPLNFTTSGITNKILLQSPRVKLLPMSSAILPTSSTTLQILPASSNNTIVTSTSTANSNIVTTNPVVSTSKATLKILPSNSTSQIIPVNITVPTSTSTLTILPKCVPSLNLVTLGPNFPVVPGNAKIMIPRIVSNVPKSPKETKIKISTSVQSYAKTMQDFNADATVDDDSNNSFDLPLQHAPTTISASSLYYVKCDICGVMVDDEDLLAAHSKVHVLKTMRCKICRAECNSLYQLYLHKRDQHNLYKRVALKFSCEQCGKLFTNSWQWENHEEHKCKKKFPAYPCKYCEVGFSTNHKLKRHLRKHKKEMLDDPEVQVYKCVACPKVFVDEEFYQKHRNVHDPECWDKFKCTLCNRSFRDNVRLKEHQQSIHDGIKPHQCDVCGRTFHRRSNMKAHREKHFGYNCEHCDENFQQMRTLITHIQEVHKVEPSPRLIAKKQYKSGCYVCRFCGKKLSTNQSVLDHERIHTGEKPHSCQICGKTFRSYTARWAHVQRHQTGSFTCEHCGKTFSYKQNLMTHILTHMPVEERKHQCSKCGKKFLRKGHLNIHMRIHNGERPYTCDICLFSFTQMGDMKRHRARHASNYTKTRKSRVKTVPICANFGDDINFIVDENNEPVQEEPIHEVEIS